MKIHMVKQGDTLYLIAKKYNVALEEMIKMNPEISNPDEIAVGMKVKIPSQPKSALEVFHQHIVQQGDSLWKLSKSWGVQLADMIKANPQLKNPNALLTGEVVNIPKTPQGAASQQASMHSNLIPGKGNTGLKPGTGMKPDTAIKPDTSIQPIPLQSLPTPPPVTITPVLPPQKPLSPLMPLVETKPTYGFEMHENTNLFMQYPVPAVQATAQAGFPYYPDSVPKGYGMQQPMVSPESVSGHGYGYQQDFSPLEGKIAGTVGGVYDHNDYIGYGAYNQLPYNQPPYNQLPYNQQPYNQPPYNQLPYNQSAVQGLTSPVSKAAGCKSCGGASVLPAHMGANAGAVPYADLYPGMEYPGGNSPYAASPFGASPTYGKMENLQHSVSPFANYPGMHYGSYPNIQAPGASMGDLTSPAAGYVPQVEPYYGGFPPIPTLPPLPPMPPMPPMGPLVDHYDDRSSSNEEDVTVAAAPAVKKRIAKPRPKQIAVKQSRPERKENLPWIKW
ncbi:LysM peptidoglycan-binding domain-containing protein [Cohnella sp.]|uniref:LysM peptidoglycan-binding domain-containing protein n=1 Tax=Cohnella sp. TaxID=1883426 RepID=UPI003561CB3E